MTAKTRIARGTLPPVTVDAQLALPIGLSSVELPPPPLRMTSHPPRFTTTTPGVMKRQVTR